MKEIVILSGKGGVGKSSIAASLGYILSKEYKIVMSDADVDAPNLDLVLGARLRESREAKSSEKASIDYDKCAGCMKCIDVCRFSSIIGTEKPLVIGFSCEGCGACALICPEQAIAIRDVANGRINIFDAGNMPLVSGELQIGESSSGRLVDVVKKAAKEEAERRGAELILTDGPPGIGCPVISSMKGSDYLIAATEPTPSALHDLKRLLEVAGYFKVPAGIVINKADIHLKSKQAVMDFAELKGMPVLTEIPYDISVPKAIANAMPVAKAYPDSPASHAIYRLADTLKSMIAGM
jgi:MinD superfamily P-loop ATPase